MADDIKIDVTGGGNQIAPNAKYLIQNFFGADYARKVLRNRNCGNEAAVSAEIVDMFYYSDTKPSPVANEIIRKSELALCTSRLESNNVLCLYGEEGVGVTTVLAQFAKQHSDCCVSYFYNGFDLMLLNTEVMERSIVDQLCWYVNDTGDFYDEANAEGETMQTLWTRLYRKIRRFNKPLYFVFDGLDNIPAEKKESVKRLLEKMPWANGRFIFSGKKDKIKEIIPSNSKLTISEYEIITFGEADVKDYFRKADSNITEDELCQLCEITRRQGHRMEVVLHRYIEKGRLKELLDYNATADIDLYEEDFNHIFAGEDAQTIDFFTLLTYSDFPLQVSVAAAILSVSEDEFIELIHRHKEYTRISEFQICTIASEGFHKYLRRKLQSFKQDMELRMLRVLQMPQYISGHSSFIPPLMKALQLTDKLVDFLNKDNVQKILVDQKSQAALNEQCEYGYEACRETPDKYTAAMFRFALNKSMSLEVEKNELWDNELEALLATGHAEQAMALAQNVYLAEERLKSFLLIARKKSLLKDSDYNILRDNIHQLVSTIQFEKIPDKAIELAKLLLPIDYESAIEVVDRVAKANKETINADRVYTLMSLLSNKTDVETGNVTNFDMVSSKIENDGLRSFTYAAKSLFADVSVDYFLNELEKLPSSSQKLHLLQIWLPEHENKENIGKAVLQAVKLIVAVSDSDMPKARILNTVCHSMSKMTREEMEQAMAYIDSITETIKYPTFDYVDAELTIIESTKELLPDVSKSRLEDLYLYINDLEDESIRLSCLSKLLGRFEYLGKKTETEKTLGCSTVEIRKDIVDGIDRLLGETAYHLKVVEEPIKALVCDYPTMIDELIAPINTEARKKRAYSLAACQYLLNEEDERIKPKALFDLLSKTDNTYENLEKPLDLLSRMLNHSDKAKHEEFLPLIKSDFHYFEELEHPYIKVVILIRLYLWMHKHFPEDTFANCIKTESLKSWDSIGILKPKIECGFLLAKNFAKVSRDDAEEILNKCNGLKAECFLASSSCVSAYDTALSLYTRSMGLLIRYGVCDGDKDIKRFADDIDAQLSLGEKAVVWSNLALEYYLANNLEQFNTLCSKYFPAKYDFCSRLDQKSIIYGVAPAMFYFSRDTLYTLLNQYDEQFRNDCLKRITGLVICKEGFLSGVSPEYKAYPLEYKDYQDLIGILEHASDDDVFYQVVTVAAKSLHSGKPQHPLSIEQKNTVANEMKRIVNEKLPTQGGIRHDGYKVACLAALDYSRADFANKDKQKWLDDISKIGNKADQAFLLMQIAPYFQKKTDKEDFFKRGTDMAESISSTFDKVNRLDMSINECVENNLGNLIKPMAETAMRSLRINGSLDDYKHLVDMVYQYKPEMAEDMVNNLDKDPARIQYKSRLLQHITSAKRIKQAHENLDTTDNLNTKEQVRFFSKQLDDLVNGKGQLLDIKRIFNLSINHIYNHNINDTQYAILYIMEDVFRKYKQSKQHRELLMNIHAALRYNLKLVLSLAADTKERIDRVETLISTRSYSADGYIRIGEEDKAKAYITNWYQSLGYNTLTIIDPYFKPQDLAIIKPLCDINNDLEIRILTHRQKFSNEDYQSCWKSISSVVTNHINLNFVWYKDNSNDGPLHDRFWICSDEENDEHCGITLCSVDSLGKKESSINPIEKGVILSALNSYTKYVYRCIGKAGGRELMYDKLNLSL